MRIELFDKGQVVLQFWLKNKQMQVGMDMILGKDGYLNLTNHDFQLYRYNLAKIPPTISPDWLEWFQGRLLQLRLICSGGVGLEVWDTVWEILEDAAKKMKWEYVVSGKM